MQPRTPIWWLAGAGLVLGLFVLPTAIQAQRYDVTITNLTGGQILSPPIVFTHKARFELFEPGQPAIPELAGVAEDAEGDPLVALLSAESDVHDVAVGGNVVLPGESLTVRIEARANARSVTALGMLVTTNDAFFSGTALANGRLTSLYAPAWDAGSEANTQDCAHIPGPPCGNGGVRVTNGAEGFVHIHGGIQKRNSLQPKDFDWRNPVAEITIRQVAQ
jgi:hypothetical protein